MYRRNPDGRAKAAGAEGNRLAARPGSIHLLPFRPPGLFSGRLGGAECMRNGPERVEAGHNATIKVGVHGGVDFSKADFSVLRIMFRHDTRTKIQVALDQGLAVDLQEGGWGAANCLGQL